VFDADIALCVLSLPELLRASESGQVILPDSISTIIPKAEDTLVLLNKNDLLSPVQLSRMDDIVAEIKKAFGVDHVWAVSIGTQSGFKSFLQEFGDILKNR
jgi:hypothetical protein